MGCCGAAVRVHSAKVHGRDVPEELDFFVGPVTDRQCKDVIFLLLFIAFLAFLGYILVIAALKGDPLRLVCGYDNWGNVCGRKNQPITGAKESGQDMTQKPYLLYVTNGTLGPSRECVRKCPEDYESTVFHQCIPKKPATTLVFQALNITESFAEKVGSDIVRCYKEIILICLSALAMACVVMLLYRFCAAVIIWVLLIAFVLVGMAGTAYLWYQWYILKEDLNNTPPSDPSKDDKEKNIKYWMAAAIVVSIITVLFLLIVIVMRKRIQLVAALFKEAGKAVGAMPMILLQPVITFMCLAAICGGWIVGFFYIYTAQDPKVSTKDNHVYYQTSSFFEGMKWYYLFALLWLTQFVIACQHVVIAGAVASWFFTRNKDHLGTPILTSIRHLVRYHLGSVALGSLLVAVVKLIRALLQRVQKFLEHYQHYCGLLLKCCQCCLWCFEKFLVYLNRNAYIEIAIYGYAFCKAAQQAFSLLTSNALRVAAISSVGDFVLFVGKVGVTVATGFIGVEIIKGTSGVHYVWIPVAISCVFALLVSHCFLGVYEMTIDTLFLCFCEDCDRNNGVTRPYYMSKSLMSFVQDSKRVMAIHNQRQQEGS